MNNEKPSLEKRRSLAVAGFVSHDPVHVMNDFYRAPETGVDRVASPYWQTMVAVLCERLCRAERWLEEVRAELAVAHALRLSPVCDLHQWVADEEDESAVCKVCGLRDSLDVMELDENGMEESGDDDDD